MNCILILYHSVAQQNEPLITRDRFLLLLLLFVLVAGIPDKASGQANVFDRGRSILVVTMDCKLHNSHDQHRWNDSK